MHNKCKLMIAKFHPMQDILLTSRTLLCQISLKASSVMVGSAELELFVWLFSATEFIIYIYIYIYIYMVRGTLNNSNFQIFKYSNICIFKFREPPYH